MRIMIDTDVLVDVLRNYPPALAWLKTIKTELIHVPGLTAFELLQGCRNRNEQRRVETFLQPYALRWPTQADCERAFADFSAYHLSDNRSILDALIAETAVGLSLELATFNQKHYEVVKTLHTFQPYTRQS